MGAMQVVEIWDAALRAGDWNMARSVVADDGRYVTQDGTACTTGDEIVELMRSFKGTLPDVEVVEWREVGDHVVARLRQPAWGDDTDWFQVLTVVDGRIEELADHPDERAALSSISA
jgi:hypothetical protein